MVDLKKADDLFAAFLKEKQFLDGTSPNKIRIYSKAWLAFKRYDAEIAERGLKNFMISMISDGKIKPSPGGDS
jgi:hypothetical protein